MTARNKQYLRNLAMETAHQEPTFLFSNIATDIEGIITQRLTTKRNMDICMGQIAEAGEFAWEGGYTDGTSVMEIFIDSLIGSGACGNREFWEFGTNDDLFEEDWARLYDY